ncbi:mucin-13 [Aegotheles albertisi]
MRRCVFLAVLLSLVLSLSKAKQFHWIITLKEIYSDNVQKTNSKEYEEVFNKLKEFFGKTFSSLDGYEQTVIVEIQPETKGRAASPMRVTVTNLFKKETTVDDKDVSSAINDAIKADPSYVTDYKVTDNCAGFNCDNRTSVCEPGEFPKCVCKSDFSKTKWDDRSCSDCRKDCSAASNEYCVMENELPTCKCLPNFKRDSGTCVSCAMGYSGEDCNDDTELILIIVGTVLGAIILILVIVISVVSVRARSRRDPEKKSLIKPEYSNSHISDDRRTTMFPRVQTTSGHANPGYQPNNPYESRFTSRGRFPERDYDDMYEASREPDGFRMQRRY